MSIFSTIKDKITNYIDVHLKLLKLNFIGQTANIMSYFMFAMICLFIVFGIILFIGLGLVEGFVAMGLPRVAACFITVGVYVLLLALVVALRRNITKFFASGVIAAMTDEDDDEKEESK